MKKAFLAANWENLAVATFEVEKQLLKEFLPGKTELNDWNGKFFLSLVGFMFSKTTLLGIPVPFYRKFEELNLRFYVKHKSNTGWKKAVVFIKEIAPSRIIGLTAKWLYHENFIHLPMNHSITADSNKKIIEYSWKVNADWNRLRLQTSLLPSAMPGESLESFIADHYYGYTKTSDDKTLEFEVQHRPWKIYPALSFDMKLDAKTIYGEEFSHCFAQKPLTAFLMDGSETKISFPALV
jgi:uncharacterized protein